MTRSPPSPLQNVKPLKRPTQARSRFTVQAIYDAFVRIWQRDGWQRLTTRNVALETGISVGTLYDYFPNKTALLSGYVRHYVESLLSCIERDAIAPPDLCWQQRLHHLIRLTCGVDTPELPWLHPEILALEAQMAEPKHHRRVHDELLTAWTQVFAACTDLPQALPANTLLALHLAVWGGRRYALLTQLDSQQMQQWALQMESLCRATVQTELSLSQKP